MLMASEYFRSATIFLELGGDLTLTSARKAKGD
jgi:hypothetical protein